jgi:hypothetical protein
VSTEIQRYPWEPPVPAQPTTEDKVAALQRDFAIAVQLTGILVHSKHPALQRLVNVPRGQIIPRGECKFTDGSTLEFQDVGMPQPNTPYIASVHELVKQVWETAHQLGLEVVP